MDTLFTHGNRIECPDCPGHGKKNRKPSLECLERNYSGCSVDVARCPECGHGFQISYKVDGITRVKQWDGQSREEADAEETARLENERIEKDRLDASEFERLKIKFGKDDL